MFYRTMAARQVTIDAKGKPPGRVATEVVRILRGKDEPSWAPNRLPEVFVTVTNAAAIQKSSHRERTKVYRRHSGAPGGFRTQSFKEIFAEAPEKVIELAVSGMLPRNRLRAQALKRLKVLRGENEK